MYVRALPREPGASQRDQSLPDQTVAYAQDIVLADESLDDATIDSATMTVLRGRVGEHRANVGVPCLSGHLLKIRLIGTFPHIVTTGHIVLPGEPVPDFAVTAVLINADAETGKVCMKGVRIGEVEPDPGAEVIPLD